MVYRVVRFILAAFLVSCVESPAPLPDAMPDTFTATDSCVREPTHECCDLLPDLDATGQCIRQQLAGTEGCGVYLCYRADCSLERVPFCI